MIVGNIMIGERYVEPQGQASIKCENTGTFADINFKTRGWMSKSEEVNAVTAKIKNQFGEIKYEIFGKYTEELFYKDLETGNVSSIFKAPSRPKNFLKMFGMNYYSLQLNVLTDTLKKKLPPTDSRFRPDIRAWD